MPSSTNIGTATYLNTIIDNITKENRLSTETTEEDLEVLLVPFLPLEEQLHEDCMTVLRSKTPRVDMVFDDENHYRGMAAKSVAGIAVCYGTAIGVTIVGKCNYVFETDVNYLASDMEMETPPSDEEDMARIFDYIKDIIFNTFRDEEWHNILVGYAD